MQPLMITIYETPNGEQKQVELRHIYPDDAVWFLANNIKLSAEALDELFIVYADVGNAWNNELEEVDEVREIANGRTTEDTFKALRKNCENALDKKQDTWIDM